MRERVRGRRYGTGQGNGEAGNLAVGAKCLRHSRKRTTASVPRSPPATSTATATGEPEKSEKKINKALEKMFKKFPAVTPATR
jgi:hypothetical protein